jgi:hypothetical protein
LHKAIIIAITIIITTTPKTDPGPNAVQLPGL